MPGDVLYVIILFAVIGVAAVVISKKSSEKFRLEMADLRGFAADHGLELSTGREPPPDLRFRALTRGDGGGQTSQRLSAADSDNAVFEYHDKYLPGNSSFRSHDDVCALVDLPFNAPKTRLSTKRPVHMAGEAKPRKIPTGDDEFDGRFWLTGKDVEFAQRLFTPAIAREMDHRLAQWPGIEVEMAASRLIAVRPLPMAAADRWAMLRWAEDLADVLGRQVDLAR